MDNEVVIRVTGDNASGPALKAAKDDTDKLGTAAEKTAVKLKAEAAESSTLERKLLELKATAHGLGEEFKRTGDTDVLKKFNETTKQSGGLEKFAKDFERLGKNAEDAGKGVEGFFSSFAVEGGGLPAVGQVTALVAGLGAVPAVAGAAGAAIGAIGLGGIAAGIAGAVKQAPQISIAFNAELAKVESAWESGSAAFVGPVLNATHDIGTALTKLPIASTLAGLAKYTQSIGTGVASAVTSIGTGLAYVLDHAGPVLRQIGPDLAQLGAAAESALTHIADGAEGGAAALHDMVTVLALATGGFGYLVQGAENAYDSIRSHPIELAIATGGLSAGASVLADLTDSSDRLTTHLTTLDTSTEQTAKSAADAAAALKLMNDAMSAAINQALGLENANIAVAAGFDDLRKAVQGHQRTLDINSDAGRQNLSVITDMIGKLERQREAAIAAGGGTQQATDQANAAFGRQIDQLRAQLKQLGFNKAAVDALVQSLDQIPGDIFTTIHISTVGGASMDKAKQQGRQQASGGIVGGAASGGLRSGMTWVGEAGPELLDMSGLVGATVHTAGDSKRIEAGEGGYGMGAQAPTVVKLVVDGSSGGDFGRMLASLIRDYVRIQGGDGATLGITN